MEVTHRKSQFVSWDGNSFFEKLTTNSCSKSRFEIDCTNLGQIVGLQHILFQARLEQIYFQKDNFPHRSNETT